MKLKNIIVAAIGLISTLGVTSCLPEPNNSVRQDFSANCLTFATDPATGESALNDGATVILTTESLKGEMSLEISNLKLPNGTYTNILIDKQKYSFNETQTMKLTLPSYTSSKDGITNTVTNFNFEYYSRVLAHPSINQAFPMIVCSFRVKDVDVRVIWNPAYYWGTTTVTDMSTGAVFTNKEVTTFYGRQFNLKDREAAVGAFGAKFAEKMPAMDLMFTKIPFSFTGSDSSINQMGYTIKKNEITPIIGQTPYPDYKVSNFVMTGVWGGSQQVSFTVTLNSEKMKGQYQVVSNLSIYPTSTTSVPK